MTQTIETEPGLRHHVSTRLRAYFPEAARIGLVVDEHVHGLWPLALEQATGAPEVVLCPVPRGERAKTRRVLADLQDRLLHLRRDEPVVVMGGGATTDVGGFAAATVRRGLPWVAIPTTVIGMADAAIGGKVGINHPRGKNLLGSFHPASLVLTDPDLLKTLEARDRISGAAELVKCARIADDDLWHTMVARGRGAGTADEIDWVAWIRGAVDVKLALVEQDPLDHGVRRLLNYGHTVGHALETMLGNDTLRHGEAVAIGMQCAMRIARARGQVDDAAVAEQTAVLSGLGLPLVMPAGVKQDALMATLALDKKRQTGHAHTFVLPIDAVGAAVAQDVTDAEILAALVDVQRSADRRR